MKSNISLVLLILLATSCDKTIQNSDSHEHIEVFGFTLIDTYWDDPTDSEEKINFADEVHAFSNVADILIIEPKEDIKLRIENMKSLDMKAILHMNHLFFEYKDSLSMSGTNYDLRNDYQERWEDFRSINREVLDKTSISCFYIGEEPYWNGITYDELNIVTNLLQEFYPEIPTMIIEAHGNLDNLKIPENADWIGFDHYFIKNPNTHSEFQKELKVLKSKLVDSSQRIMIIMDSHYIDWAHGDYAGISLKEMKLVATNYYQLAKNNSEVIGILGYFWPNGFDIENSIGARGMPEDVLNEYIRIGKEITGK